MIKKRSPYNNREKYKCAKIKHNTVLENNAHRGSSVAMTTSALWSRRYDSYITSFFFKKKFLSSQNKREPLETEMNETK